MLWRTRFGLRLRSTGENPYAAESLGVGVYGHKYAAVIVSGGLAGMGGAALVLFPGQLGYLEGQTGGRGYIGLAAMIFGNWRPVGTLAGAALFGFVDGLQLRTGGEAVHALLYGASLLAVGVRRVVAGPAAVAAGRVVGLAAGLVVYLLYISTETVPRELATYSPQLVTLIVLAVSAQRLRPPAADGLGYRRGEGAVTGAGAVDAAPDWPALRAAAVAAAGHAYAPYSGLMVGAAALCDDGRVVVGCNVENASYGLALCAECTLAGQLRLTGGGRLVAVACRSGTGELLLPCGRCRQVLYEFGGAGCLVDAAAGPRPLGELLPEAFGPDDLPARPG